MPQVYRIGQEPAVRARTGLVQVTQRTHRPVPPPPLLPPPPPAFEPRAGSGPGSSEREGEGAALAEHTGAPHPGPVQAELKVGTFEVKGRAGSARPLPAST